MRGGKSEEEMMKYSIFGLVLLNLRKGHFQENMKQLPDCHFIFFLIWVHVNHLEGNKSCLIVCGGGESNRQLF